MNLAPPNDRSLFFITTLLTIFGLVVVYSASSVLATSKHGMSLYYFLRQLAYAAVGYLIMLGLIQIDYRIYQKKRVVFVLLVLSGMSLLYVLTQPPINGASRWILLPFGLSFQPSEMAKVILLIFLAWYLDRFGRDLRQSWKIAAGCILVVGIFAGLIRVEPDLGQAVCIVALAGLVLFLAGMHRRHVGLALVSSGLIAGYAIVTSPFRMDRIKTFFDAFFGSSSDPHGAAWQPTQAVTGIGSGGFLGLGPGGSNQKLHFLPEAHSDFIFAVIGEEWGFIGAAAVVALFAIFFLRGLRVAFRAPDAFGTYLALGITLMVVVQALVNISVVTGMFPTTGIALPFISQGGSSLLMNLCATGILLNISNHMEQS